MQELIDYAHELDFGGWEDIFIQKGTELLDLEKEQIMNAYSDGAKGGANGTKGQHEFGWVSIHTRNKYYNEKYNQNK